MNAHKRLHTKNDPHEKFDMIHISMKLKFIDSENLSQRQLASPSLSPNVFHRQFFSFLIRISFEHRIRNRQNYFTMTRDIHDMLNSRDTESQFRSLIEIWAKFKINIEFTVRCWILSYDICILRQLTLNINK